MMRPLIGLCALLIGASFATPGPFGAELAWRDVLECDQLVAEMDELSAFNDCHTVGRDAGDQLRISGAPRAPPR